MNDDLEPRLHEALHSGSLPSAPPSLMEALERVPDAPVRSRQRRGAGPIVGLFAAAAVLLVASAVALTGGSAPKPGPTAKASPLSGTQVSTVWNTDGSTALVIHRDPTDKGSYYWRARTFDQIGLKGWSTSTPTTVDRPAGASILDKLPEDPDPTGLHPFTFTVQPDGFHESTIFSPGTPTEVQEDSHLTTVGPGYFTGLDRDSGGTTPYTVTALTQVGGEKPGELNDALLEAAGTDYPQSITDLYLGVADGQMGDNAKRLESRIKAESPSQTPFDLAQTMVKDLHNPANFTYTTDVRDLDCAAISTVECFATFKKGFCQYYAPTMAVLMRDMGVPTRMVEGFLPGTVDPHTGIETIPFSSAHAWVEVYFPGIGWVMFDPTGGDLSQVAPLPSGQPVAAGVPRLHLEYTAQTVDGVAPTPADMANVASVLRSRVAAMGVADSTVTTHDLVVVVDLPGVVDAADVETVGRILGHTGKIEFVPLGDTLVPVGEPVDPTKNPPLFGGDQIASATIAADQNGAPAVDFVLKPDGTRLFADYTANHIGSYFAITMDGDVLSAPVIQNAIPNGDIEISGGGVTGLDAMHAHGLVALIGSGELPVPLALTSSSVLGVPSPAASTP